MKNPFIYGGIVESSTFCNRKTELKELRRMIENGVSVFISSERRFGKTSLALLALKGLSDEHFLRVYVDVWPTDNERDFITILAREYTRSLSPSMEKALQSAKSLFSLLLPSIGVDFEGKPVLQFEMRKREKPEPELEEVLNAAEKIARRTKKHLIVVLDEVQQIMEYGSDLVERKLRSIMQRQSNVSYLFLGSRKHLIQKMFLTRTRPLYRSATHFPLNDISNDDWLPFVRKHYEASGKRISNATIQTLLTMTQAHPYYTQYLCHVAWELTGPGKTVTARTLRDALKILLQREHYAFSVLWESLTRNQQRFLQGLTVEGKGVKPFSIEFLTRHAIGTASSAQRVVKALMQRDIIEPDNGSFIVSDRLFRLWIQQTLIME